jgi:hypothetical protein
MLTPLDLSTNYWSLRAESERITGFSVYDMIESENYINLTQEDSLTTEQWNNLVKVASVIKANVNRFDMKKWHRETECGTCHCLAGWAQSLEQNDTNFRGFDAEYVGRMMLSKFVSPFFWVSRYNLIPLAYHHNSELHQQHEGLPEQLVMKYLIDPVLEEARRESYELSSELNEFIQKAKQETLVAN